MFRGRGVRVEKENKDDGLKGADTFCHKVILDIQDENGVITQTNEYDVEAFVSKKGQLQHSVVFIKDLSQLKHFREKYVLAKQQTSILSELAVQAMHEIKNPLSAIKGFAQLLKENLKKDEEKLQYINIMIDEIERLDKLVKEVFSLAPDKETRDSQEEDINYIIEEIIPLSNMYAQTNKKQVRFVKELCDDKLYVSINRDQIKQVFVNLIYNAIEAIEKNGEIQITTYKHKEYCVVKIKDTGKGISKDDLEKVFAPFFTTKDNGTGLGLYIVKRIVTNYGGTIDVESEEGKGTQFIIKFPLIEENF